MLYPRESISREIKDLSGIWRFKVDKDNIGLKEKWFKEPIKETIPMPVPSSYNDITQDPDIRDHIGDVWYERYFFVPQSWYNKRVVLRFGSVTHKAKVFINGKEVSEHKGGFLPFEIEINDFINFEQENRLTVLVNNVLEWDCLPPGFIKTYNDTMHPAGYKTQEYLFDFFNYSGIHRPVILYSTPKTYIEDIKVNTDIKYATGIIEYSVDLQGEECEKKNIRVKVFDKKGHVVAECFGQNGILNICCAQLWEPNNPYLYQMQVETYFDDKVEDVYNLPVGIRTIKVSGNKLLLNDKPIYLKGFGKHEDADIRGKGFDNAIAIKDFNLMKWIGANSFRTSHYPYAEEILNLADEEGILVIDEAPAVGMNFFNYNEKVFDEKRVNDKTLEHHIEVINDLIKRDKNHPCVIMWSVANEAATYEDEAFDYFKRVVEEVKKIDKTRPVTIVESSFPDESKVGSLVDVICVNRYYSWYTDSGKLDIIELQLEQELKRWYELYKKPVIVTEYGADTIPGFHSDPPLMFSEEYQCEMLDRYHRVFDRLDFVVGEHVWNFADFATKQEIKRVMGNKKGVFTRQRQPKAVAFLLKTRWNNLKNK